jgi:hypothetical protein
MIRAKQITIIKIRIKIDTKINIEGMKLKKRRFKTKYVAIKSLRTKFDIISK